MHHSEREYNGNILGLQLLYTVYTDFFFFLLHILLLEIIDCIPKCFFSVDIILAKPFLMRLALTVFQVQNTTLEKKIFHSKFSKSGKNHFITTDLAAPLGLGGLQHVLKSAYRVKYMIVHLACI